MQDSSKHNKNICNIISRHHGYTTNLPNKFKVKETDDETFKNLRQEFYEKILVYFNTSDNLTAYGLGINEIREVVLR